MFPARHLSVSLVSLLLKGFGGSSKSLALLLIVVLPPKKQTTASTRANKQPRSIFYRTSVWNPTNNLPTSLPAAGPGPNTSLLLGPYLLSCDIHLTSLPPWAKSSLFSG